MIELAKYYYLVINDRFEMFYRGIIKAFNPYSKYVKASCPKGYSYPRYFTYTPKEDEVGSYPLTITIYDDDGKEIESKTTTLIVNKPKKPTKKLNVLCIGDSLTYSGDWPYEGYRRFCEESTDGFTLGFKDSLNLFGKCKKTVIKENEKVTIGYEGYGGWQWKTFCSDMENSPTSSVWIKCKHNKTEEDQHSVWVNNGYEWILETIEKDRLKFKRGENNKLASVVIDKTFYPLKNVIHEELIEVEEAKFDEGNPFWNKEKNDIDFQNYIKINNFQVPDLIFILLTWNGQYIPYNNDFSVLHKPYVEKILTSLHQSFPSAKIVCMGIQIVCPNGGITSTYGADGYYNDWYGDAVTAFNYNKWLEELLLTDKYKDYCLYSDVKAQFDSEYNMPYKMVKVNNRSNIEERVGTNGIHPSINGYLQIGDVFYRMLVHVTKDM